MSAQEGDRKPGSDEDQAPTDPGASLAVRYRLPLGLGLGFLVLAATGCSALGVGNPRTVRTAPTREPVPQPTFTPTETPVLARDARSMAANFTVLVCAGTDKEEYLPWGKPGEKDKDDPAGILPRALKAGYNGYPGGWSVGVVINAFQRARCSTAQPVI